jgi:hypothetical protein
LRRRDRTEADPELRANGRRCGAYREVSVDERQRTRQVPGVHRLSRDSNARFTRSASFGGRQGNHDTDTRSSPASKGVAAHHHSRAENDQDRFFQDVGVLRKDVIVEHLELLVCFWLGTLCSKSQKQPRTAIQRLL